MILHQWAHDGCYADHPFFIAKPHAKQEDEGVILSVGLDCNNKKSFLLMLDAQNFKELCRIYLPHHIPFGINGIFLNHKG